MKFTTLIPTTRNDGTAFTPRQMQRWVSALWRPFRGATEEGPVRGHWIDDDGIEFTDTCIKVSVEYERTRLTEAMRAVKRLGRKLDQRAMYFEVDGYDGVQILRIQ